MNTYIEYLAFLSPALVLLPSLFRRSRATAIAAFVIFVLLTFALLSLLSEVETMTSGEGPAFFAIVTMYAGLVALLVASCIAKTFLNLIFQRLSAPSRELLSKSLYILCLVVCIVAAGLRFVFFASFGLALFFGLPAIWLALILWRMPHPSNPTAQIGVKH